MCRHAGGGAGHGSGRCIRGHANDQGRSLAIAAMRAALRRTLRRPREQLWLLLHAPSLLDGPDSAAKAIALPEDDYRRLAVRRRETHSDAPKAPIRTGTVNVRPSASKGKGTIPMSDDQPVTDLVTQARNGDSKAWDALVERYAPLIWSICRRHRLADADARDVGQNVWLRLVDQLGTLRDPAALPGWLVTTTRRECSRMLSAAARDR